MKNFAITGVAGYVAPRHLKAIKETGNDLVAALDPHDSVGIMDSFFPNASFFTEFERFERHFEKIRRSTSERKIDYLSICSPNFLHDSHIRLALRNGADAICEKPIVLNPWNLDILEELEKETNRKIYNILQLREHKSILELKNKIDSENNSKKYDIVLTYITSRGLWYDFSWKGIKEKSGGVATNIGVHFFDLLSWIFGSVQRNEIYLDEPRKVSGFLELENANIRWFLSIDKNDLPFGAKESGKTTYRSLTIDNDNFEFSDGFTDLHTKVYESILSGNGFRIADARRSIEIVHQIRNNKVISKPDYGHPFLESKI